MIDTARTGGRPVGCGSRWLVGACGRSCANAHAASSSVRSGYSARRATSASGQCERPWPSGSGRSAKIRIGSVESASWSLRLLPLEWHQRAQVDERRHRPARGDERQDQPVERVPDDDHVVVHRRE